MLYEVGLSLRACVFREWTLMDTEQSSSVCAYIVHYLVSHPEYGLPCERIRSNV